MDVEQMAPSIKYCTGSQDSILDSIQQVLHACCMNYALYKFT